MNRYEITTEELKFLQEMAEYLKDSGNSCSEQGSKQLKEVFDRISSRPVMKTVIDPKVFREENKALDTLLQDLPDQLMKT